MTDVNQLIDDLETAKIDVVYDGKKAVIYKALMYIIWKLEEMPKEILDYPARSISE